MSTAVLLSGGLDSAVLTVDEAASGIVHPVYVSAGLAWEPAEKAIVERFLERAPGNGQVRPLVSLEIIRDRLDAVEELAFRATDRGKLRATLKAVQDLERLVARIALGTAGPRDPR